MKHIEKLLEPLGTIVGVVLVAVALLVATNIIPVQEDVLSLTVGGLFASAFASFGLDYLNNREGIKALLAYLKALPLPLVSGSAEAIEKILDESGKFSFQVEVDTHEPPNGG